MYGVCHVLLAVCCTLDISGSVLFTMCCHILLYIGMCVLFAVRCISCVCYLICVLRVACVTFVIRYVRRAMLCVVFDVCRLCGIVYHAMCIVCRVLYAVCLIHDLVVYCWRLLCDECWCLFVV